MSKADQERYTRKLGVLYDAVGDGTCTVLTDLYEILPKKWSDSIYPGLLLSLEMFTCSYLSETPSQFTRENPKAYKSLDPFNYYIRYV